MMFQAIGVREVEACLRRPYTLLIDLRTKEEYDMSHLEGAINIPYEDLERYKKRLSKQNAYILYCERGGSSLLAAKELSREGYSIYTVIGGIRAWEDDRLN